MAQEHRRLDPETILKRMQQQEADESDGSGILKIYLGYSAGVGKTYRMLQNARQLKSSGVDVVIGIVETHKRAETEALLADLEIIPRRKIEYQGITIDEMDIDAVMKRKPALVLVDEMAHTNIPGSRNTKRWQDIEELINDGISVVTTLNVQHLESINDIVEQMTGIKVKEIVPDSSFDNADEIELVDIPIEELERRLKDGKVYIPEKARTAMLEFFKKSNLMGLRELSLRYTARQVGDEFLNYMRENSMQSQVSVSSRLLIAISSSPSSQKLIRIGHRMAEDLNAEWYTVYIESIQFGNVSEDARAQAEKNLKLAEDLGAKTITLIGNTIADEIARFAVENNITLILIGFSSRSRFNNIMRGSVVNDLIRKAKPIQVMLVDSSDEQKLRQKKPAAKKKIDFVRYIITLIIVLIFTGISFIFFKELGFTNVVMLMLIPVIIVSTYLGREQGIWASLLSVASLDYFFVEPYFKLSVNNIRYLPIFVVFFIVGISTSILSDRLRWRIDIYRDQEKFLFTIYNFSKELLTYNQLSDILRTINKNISEFFKCEVVILLPNKEDIVKIMGSTEKTESFSGNESGIAQWVYKNGKTAGRGTDTLSSSQWFYLPMKTHDSVIGVLAILKKDNDPQLSKDQARYLDSFANISAMSISRALSMSSYLDYIMKSL